MENKYVNRKLEKEGRGNSVQRAPVIVHTVNILLLYLWFGMCHLNLNR